MKMQEDQDDFWKGVKFSSPKLFSHEFEGDSHLDLFEKVIDLRKSKDKFGEDIINTIDVSTRKKIIVVGTEKGRVIVFSIHHNKVMMCILSDNWLNSTIIFHKTVVCSGFNKKIEFYSMRSKPCLFRIHCSTKLDGFTNKGVIFKKLNQRCYMISNVGYLKFKVLNVHTRRVLKCFNLTEKDFSNNEIEHNQNDSSLGVLSNYTMMSNSKVIAFTSSKESNLYFYDLLAGKMINSIRIKDPVQLGSKYFVANTLMLTYGDWVVYIQQFLKNMTRNQKRRNFLYLCKLEKSGLQGKPEAKQLMDIELEDLEIIISSDIINIEHLFCGASNGFVLVLGTTIGNTLTYVLDIDKLKCIRVSVMKGTKKKGSLLLHRRRNICHDCIQPRHDLLHLQRKNRVHRHCGISTQSHLHKIIEWIRS